MKNQNLLSLLFVLSLLTKAAIKPIWDLQNRLRILLNDNPEKIDLSLELEIGLRKFLTIQIMRLTSTRQLTKEQADLSTAALNNLFDGKCGWWYKNKFLISYPGEKADWTLRIFFESLLLEVACDHKSSIGEMINFPEKERTALIMWKGLTTDKSLSLELIGDELNLSRERVRQINVKNMRLILKAAEKKGIKMNFWND